MELFEASFYNVDGKNVLIELSDDGAGISEEHLPRIFERFIVLILPGAGRLAEVALVFLSANILLKRISKQFM